MRWLCLCVVVVFIMLSAHGGESACTTAQLTAEFQNDPAVPPLGYAPLIAAGNDAGVHEAFTRIRPSTEAGYRVFRGLIPTWEIVNQYDPTEYATIMTDQIKANQLIGVTNAQQIDVRSANTAAILRNLFPVGGPTRANLTAIAKTDGSRAEVLCHNGNHGYTVTLAEVSLALTPLRPTN